MDNIHWDRVERGLARENHRMIWRPYGLPTVSDPNRSAFFDGEVSPRWNIPQQMAVSVAITGAFFQPEQNPNQPITPRQIYEEARAVAAAGASTVHIHVRDDKGYNTLSAARFREVIAPLKEEFPHLAVDGCLVAALDGEWEQMKEVLAEGLLDGVPINTAATYVGDALFAKPREDPVNPRKRCQAHHRLLHRWRYRQRRQAALQIRTDALGRVLVLAASPSWLQPNGNSPAGIRGLAATFLPDL
jgi:3-keto-5-aminohexanoate cleavage enzyme